MAEIMDIFSDFLKAYFYCQAQPSPSSSFSWLAELALFSFNPATRPSRIVVK
jgi:hypothetical protein